MGQIYNKTGEDSNTLLRRLVKLLESQAVVDSANRQKITIDSTTSQGLYTGGLTTALAGETVTAGAPSVAGTIYPFYVWETPVDQRWRVIEAARHNYAASIRSNLSFT